MKTTTPPPTSQPPRTSAAHARPDPRHHPKAGPGFRAFLATPGKAASTRRGAEGGEDLERAGHLARPERAHVARREDDDAREREHDARGEDDDALGLALEPFTPPPPVLCRPLGPASVPLTTGSALAHAEAAALADRLVTSLRVGKVGRDGHEVRMRLAISERAEVDVRLRLVGGELTAHLVAARGAADEAEGIARALRTELSARGFSVDDVRVELG
jgi:hypothetical protein